MMFDLKFLHPCILESNYSIFLRSTRNQNSVTPAKINIQSHRNPYLVPTCKVTQHLNLFH